MLRLKAAALPGVVLVLLPKCPACLAAWIAVATGVSIPVAAAARLNAIVAALCVTSVAAIVVRLAVRGLVRVHFVTSAPWDRRQDRRRYQGTAIRGSQRSAKTAGWQHRTGVTLASSGWRSLRGAGDKIAFSTQPCLPGGSKAQATLGRRAS